MDLKQSLHFDPYGNLWTHRTRERLAKLTSWRYVVGKARLIAHEMLHPDEPWITQDAVKLLDALLRTHHRGFEWGSGNGSAWIAARCKTLVSVEHDRAWHAKVAAKMRERGLTNHDYRRVDEDVYLAVIEEFPDEHFDFVIVDGLFRDEAFLRSIPKLRGDGFIVFDNANWYLPSSSRTPHSRSFADGPQTETFGRVMERVNGWKTVWTTNDVNDTAIFFKPLPL